MLPPTPQSLAKPLTPAGRRRSVASVRRRPPKNYSKSTARACAGPHQTADASSKNQKPKPDVLPSKPDVLPSPLPSLWHRQVAVARWLRSGAARPRATPSQRHELALARTKPLTLAAKTKNQSLTYSPLPSVAVIENQKTKPDALFHRFADRSRDGCRFLSYSSSASVRVSPPAAQRLPLGGGGVGER